MIDGVTSKQIENMSVYVAKRDSKSTRPSGIASTAGKVDLQCIIDAIIEDGCYSFEQWSSMIFKLHGHDHPSRKLLVRILGHPRSDYYQRADDDYIRNHMLSMSWIDSMWHQRLVIYNLMKEGYYGNIKDGVRWLRRIVEYNGLEFTTFVDSVFTVMNKEVPKKNTIFFYGPSNAGKSRVADSITGGFPLLGEVTRSETFLFMNCVRSQCIRQEEVKIVQETVDDFKRLYEGSNMMVDVKNKPAQRLARTPVIATSNAHPSKWVESERDAIINRMYLYQFQTMPLLIDLDKNLNPLLWLYLALKIELTEIDIVADWNAHSGRGIKRKMANLDRPATPDREEFEPVVVETVCTETDGRVEEFDTPPPPIIVNVAEVFDEICYVPNTPPACAFQPPVDDSIEHFLSDSVNELTLFNILD
jgi:hypothetical protein